MTNPGREALVERVRQIIEVKTKCDANGRCRFCDCEVAAREVVAVVESALCRKEK